MKASAQPVPNFAAIAVGDLLPALTLPPVSRATLALFAGASGDHNPIHIDPDFARAAGMPDVFAQGMLSMAWLGRLLTRWAPQDRLRHFKLRFVDLTHIGDIITCTGRVAEKFERAGEHLVRIELATVGADGRVRVSGEALVALD